MTLQLQLDWGWTPALAAIGMLPQVVVLIAGGAFVNPFVQRVGLDRAAWLSAAAVVLGLAVYALLGSFGYVWVAIALALVAAGMRVVGVVAGVNVLRGLPKNRTTIGAALVDTATEVTSGVGIAVTGTILAALFTGDIATSNWSAQQTAQFQEAVTIAGARAHRRGRGARRLGHRPGQARRDQPHGHLGRRGGSGVTPQWTVASGQSAPSCGRCPVAATSITATPSSTVSAHAGTPPSINPGGRAASPINVRSSSTVTPP